MLFLHLTRVYTREIKILFYRKFYIFYHFSSGTRHYLSDWKGDVSVAGKLRHTHLVFSSREKKKHQEGRESVTVGGFKSFSDLSSGLTGIPRSPVRSLRVRSSICSWTVSVQVRKEKKKHTRMERNLVINNNNNNNKGRRHTSETVALSRFQLRY